MYNYTAHENWGYFGWDTRVSVTKRLDRQPYAQQYDILTAKTNL